MLQFSVVQDDFLVKDDGILVGYICQGVFSSVTHYQFDRPEALEEIALKMKEVKIWGNTIPICPECQRTPMFAKTLIKYKMIGSELNIVCGDDFHNQRPAK